jgi:hypothetical protein
MVSPTGAQTGCATHAAITDLLNGLGQDSWRSITPKVAMNRWPGLVAIGYDASHHLPVLLQRGTVESTGEPTCVERYSFIVSNPDNRPDPVLRQVEVVHQESEREAALDLARTCLSIIVPTPRPGPSGRGTLDEGVAVTPVFSADHGWVRSHGSIDADARESVVVTVRAKGEVWRLVLTWTRDFR